LPERAAFEVWKRNSMRWYAAWYRTRIRGRELDLPPRFAPLEQMQIPHGAWRLRGRNSSPGAMDRV
jgi:hypothetical protein